MIHIGFGKEARSIAKDFVAGVDPTGIATHGFGANDERAGMSKGRRFVRQSAGVAGGVIGGGVGIPALTMGAIRGVQGSAAGSGGGIRGRIAGGVRGFLRGAKEPLTRAYSANRARWALRQAATRGKAIPQSVQKSMKETLKHVSVGELAGAGKRLSGPSGKGPAPAAMAAMLQSKTTPKSLIPRIRPLVRGASNDINTGLAAGAVVGGGSAAMQYSRGVSSEKETQRRVRRVRQLSPGVNS